MWIWLLLIAGVVAIDQATKWLVIANMELHESIVVIPDVLNWTYTRNLGAAMGMLSEQRWVFMILSSVAIVLILWYLFKNYKESRFADLSLSLIVGGGIGNMIDRVFYEEGVIDFVDFCAFDFWTYIFNFADACVCVGGGMLMLWCIIALIKESKQNKQKESEPIENLGGDNPTNE